MKKQVDVFQILLFIAVLILGYLVITNKQPANLYQDIVTEITGLKEDYTEQFKVQNEELEILKLNDEEIIKKQDETIDAIMKNNEGINNNGNVLNLLLINSNVTNTNVNKILIKLNKN